MLALGKKIPAFTLEGSHDTKLASKDLLGKYAVIVFYPKNNTPGWNRQLAALEEYRAKFESLNTTVLAINPASVSSHQNYCDKKGFSFLILSDPDEQIIIKFKAQKPEGKGVLRTVYAFDPEGKVIFAERGMASYDDIISVIKESK